MVVRRPFTVMCVACFVRVRRRINSLWKPILATENDSITLMQVLKRSDTADLSVPLGRFLMCCTKTSFPVVLVSHMFLHQLQQFGIVLWVFCQNDLINFGSSLGFTSHFDRYMRMWKTYNDEPVPSILSEKSTSTA